MLRREFYPPPVRLYREMARRGYRRHAAYRAATWAGVFTNTVFGFMLAYILLAVYERRDDVGGYDVVDAVTYVWLGQALLATVAFMGWADVSDRIRNGDIAIDLSRPVHPLWTGLAADFGRSAYHLLYRGIPPFLLGALVFEVSAPGDPFTGAAFALSLTLGVAASYAFRVLYNLSAFWLLDVRGARTMAVSTMLFFSGFIVPLRFFPDWLETVARATPFPTMFQIPIDVYLEKYDGVGLAAALLSQIAWAAALLACAYGAYALGTRKLVVQGG